MSRLFERRREEDPRNTKTHERRTLTFPRSLKESLAAQAEGKGPAGLLFTSADGQPLDNSNFAQRVLNEAWNQRT